jgi:phosphatidylethanolamine-binding protein (PEBP) family uncharacterized protein
MKYVLSPHQNTRLAVILLATILLTLRGSAAMAMTLNSPAFKNGHIPAKYTCEGEDISPPLALEGVPNGAKSLVLIIDDPDAPDPKAPKMVWVHWVVYNIPGPCPRTQARQGCLKAPYLGSMISKRLGTAARVRRSVGTVTSIRSTRATKSQMERAMRGHVLANAELIGTYQKGDR